MQISSSFTLHASSPSCIVYSGNHGGYSRASDLPTLELDIYVDIDTMNTRILRAARVSNC